MVIVSSEVTSPKVLITVVIEMIMMIVITMMIVMIVIYCVMNNFLLVMHFVDKMWDVHPDVYVFVTSKRCLTDHCRCD
jgi:type IV secretory pathway VirB3-like protein